jgi:hypothetical protein
MSYISRTLPNSSSLPEVEPDQETGGGKRAIPRRVMEIRSDADRARTRSFDFDFVSSAIVILTAAVGLAQPEVARAEPSVDQDPFDRPGFYTGIGGSYQYNVFNSRIEDVIEDEVDDALPGANSSFDLDDSGGLNALLGYRVASWFALELQYEWVDEYDIKGSTEIPVPASGDLYSIEGHTLTANTKWIIPFWRIQPYLLLGGGVGPCPMSVKVASRMPSRVWEPT